jgi:hypothetical protein
MLGDAVSAKKASGEAADTLEVIDVAQLLARSVSPVAVTAAADRGAGAADGKASAADGSASAGDGSASAADGSVGAADGSASGADGPGASDS